MQPLETSRPRSGSAREHTDNPFDGVKTVQEILPESGIHFSTLKSLGAVGRGNAKDIAESIIDTTDLLGLAGSTYQRPGLRTILRTCRENQQVSALPGRADEVRARRSSQSSRSTAGNREPVGDITFTAPIGDSGTR
ncbi:hypothetical protein Landi51_08494 [Colletotrichum acutatum]